MQISRTLPDHLLVYFGCRENKGDQLVDLGGQGEQIRSNMIGQIRGRLSVETAPPFLSKTLRPAGDLVDKRRTEFANKTTLGTHRKEFLAEIGLALHADYQRLAFIPEFGLGRQTFPVCRRQLACTLEHD